MNTKLDILAAIEKMPSGTWTFFDDDALLKRVTSEVYVLYKLDANGKEVYYDTFVGSSCAEAIADVIISWEEL